MLKREINYTFYAKDETRFEKIPKPGKPKSLTTSPLLHPVQCMHNHTNLQILQKIPNGSS